TLPVFKIGRSPRSGGAGFDSQALPPTFPVARISARAWCQASQPSPRSADLARRPRASAKPFFPPSWTTASAFRTNVSGARPFRRRFLVEADALPFVECLKTAGLHRAPVKEPFLPAIVTDEPEPPVTYQPLDRTARHRRLTSAGPCRNDTTPGPENQTLFHQVVEMSERRVQLSHPETRLDSGRWREA